MDPTISNFSFPHWSSGQVQSQQPTGTNSQPPTPNMGFQLFMSQTPNQGIMNQGGQFGGGLNSGPVPNHPFAPPQFNAPPIMGNFGDVQQSTVTPLLTGNFGQAQNNQVGKILSPQTLNGDFETLWKEVRSELESQGFSTWRRKKALGETLQVIDTNQPISMSDLVEEIRNRSPILSEMGRQRPGWDNVFNAITCGYGQHRRHIVMSSVMRMATYKVFDSTLNNENDQMKLKQGLISLYNKKELSEGKTPTVFQSPEQLESAITSMFHNNKANIFLGGGKFNSAIGGLAHQAEKIEEQTIGALKTAGSRDDVVKLAEGWIEQMGKASVFGNTNQRDFIVGVFKDMIDMLTSEPGDKIQLANDIVGVIRDFYDTMANDVSEASNTNLKHFQNDTMMQMQIEFMKLCAAPNVDGLLRLTEGFINAEVYGLQMLDIDEAQLYSGNQTEISKLQKAI